MGILTMVGKQFGRLTVINFVTRAANGQAIWNCKCSCGNFKEIKQTNLTRTTKPSRSCGCLARERSSEVHKGKPSHRKLPDGVAGFNLLVGIYKKQAKKRNLNFSLTNEELKVLFKGNCFYCGIEPLQKINGYIYNGLDRQNNKLGYLLTNVVSCCKDCNKMKLTYSVSEFVYRCKKIARNFT